MHAAPYGYDYSPYPGKSRPPSPGGTPTTAPAHGPAASGATALSQSSPVLVLLLAAVALKQHI